MYNSTKGYVHDTVTPRVDAAYKTVHAVVDPAVRAAMNVVDPAVQAAKPTVESAYKMVEPMVQPAMDKANALKERILNGEQKVEEEESDEEGWFCRLISYVACVLIFISAITHI